MRIIPAIDLKEGKCVRLFKGDFNKVTEYSSNPATVGKRFSELHVRDLHIVDLDGARSGIQNNQEIVQEIVQEFSADSGLDVQVGGGIRDRADVVRWLDTGISRCVVGSVAINDPGTVKAWIAEFGASAIVLALDVKLDAAKTPMLTTEGWRKESGISLWACIDRYRDIGLEHVLCTDVARDGAMAGPNLDLYREIIRRYPGLALQASGGVRHVADLNSLRSVGVAGAISGRALLDGKISASEVASFSQNA